MLITKGIVEGVIEGVIMEGLINACIFHIDDTGGSHILKIDISDNDLSELETYITVKSGNDLQPLNRESLDNQKSYQLLNDDRNSYQLVKMQGLLDMITNPANELSYLNTFNDLYDHSNKKMIYDGLVYFSRTEKDNFTQEQLSIFNLKKTGILKNKEWAIFNHKFKSATDDHRYTELVSIDDGLNLPTDGCIATFISRKDLNVDIPVVTGNIFDTFVFDRVFNDVGMKEKYTENVLTKFEKNDLKLTAEDLVISITDKAAVLNAIKTDVKLLDAFASFKGDKRSTIQKVSRIELESVIRTLEKYIAENAEFGLTINDLPKIQGDTIILTKESVKVFASLLENKVIEKLLTHTITIPYI